MLANPLTRNFPQTTGQAQAISTDKMHDLELLQRIAAKEEAALLELYAAYNQRLYAFALRLTGDPAQAEDVVQETLVAVWRSAGKYRGQGRPLAWLLGIVHHTAIKSLRHRSTPITEEMEASLPAQELMPEERVQANEQITWVHQGLEKLSPEHRAVLELVFYQGLSLQEAAEVFGCPLGTVKSRLSYARQHLRSILSRTEELR